MYSLACFLPLFGFFLVSLWGFYFGRMASIFLAISNIFFSFVISLFIFYEVVLCKSLTLVALWEWALLDYYKISFGFLFDSLTSLMFLIITGISLCVHFYSVGYMDSDPHITRFFSYLSLFTFFMLFLVSSDNLVQLFVGWEGVGVCSFLLINFWYTRIAANKAALKAMIMNRIADVFFVFAIILVFLNFKTTEFLIVFDLVKFVLNENLIFFNFRVAKIDLICFCLFVGAIGKSAQIGFHTWLADAMEGPTPVSALLHAATMVTAGVFLLIRCSFFFDHSTNILFFITIFGGLTAFFFGLVGIFQFDLKKVIAYSTCSQLGYMFFSCGLSNYQISVFHLFNHAFFKALLFLSAGSIIHALFDEQDMRKMGNLVHFLPFTYFCIFLGSLAIMGFPFLTGFFSKDLLLETTFSRYFLEGTFIYFLGICSAFFTSVYSFRLVLFVFFFHSNFYNAFKIHEANSFMMLPMFFLCLCSIFVGYLFSDAFSGWGSFFFNNSIFSSPIYFSNISAEFLSPLIKQTPLLTTFWGILISLTVIKFFEFNSFFINRTFFTYNALINIHFALTAFFYYAGFFNLIFNMFYLNIFKFSYSFNTKIIDKGFLEFFGPVGLYNFFYYFSNSFRQRENSFAIFFKIGLLYSFLSFFIFFFVIFDFFSFNFAVFLIFIVFIWFFI
jgi:proton-translocating NADH-quinone oxidoreductase chain L